MTSDDSYTDLRRRLRTPGYVTRAELESLRRELQRSIQRNEDCERELGAQVNAQAATIAGLVSQISALEFDRKTAAAARDELQSVIADMRIEAGKLSVKVALLAGGAGLTGGSIAAKILAVMGG